MRGFAVIKTFPKKKAEDSVGATKALKKENWGFH
jgi:hypothetical protein